MTKVGSANGSFFGNLIYERLLSQRDHFLKDLAQTVDFRFVREACRDFYVDWGRDAWDPVLMFKMVCLQFLYDLSDRDIEEQATFNMIYKWFLGLSAEELPRITPPCAVSASVWGPRVSRNSSIRWWSRPGSGVSSRIASTSSMPPISPPRWTCFA